MKIIALAGLLTLPFILTACTKNSETEHQAALNKATQIGQAQAIATIIEKAMSQPCQPINLFNNVDENNKKEVNLINISCENLNLPELSAQTDTPAE